MSSFVHLPLGHPIPNRPHAVSCSLPTMRDVIGYEEKDPATVSQLSVGYPRFFLHPCIRQLTAQLHASHNLAGQELCLVCSARMADEAATRVPGVAAIEIEGLPAVTHPVDATTAHQLRRYLQNTGGFFSSRQAEDELVRRGLCPAPPLGSEPVGGRDPVPPILATLRRAFPGTTDADFALAPAGMNAFHTAWRASADLQATRGRTVWIQLGWLYLDTIALLKQFAPAPTDYVYLLDVGDFAAIRAAILAAGDQLAGLVTEAPTNPLVQTADLPAIADLVWATGGHMIVDPTLLSPFNAQVLPYADLVINSLTKYSASEGDVIAGVSILNAARPDAPALRAAIADRADAPYPKDLARLAEQIGHYERLITVTNASTPRIVAYLQNHPKVAQVFWSQQPGSRENYLKLAPSPRHCGSMISFTLTFPLAEFYDRLRMSKGPSFGLLTTLICPFIYLAHYDLVTSEAGRAELAASGINPELLRLSIGCEPPDEIIAVLDEALGV